MSIFVGVMGISVVINAQAWERARTQDPSCSRNRPIFTRTRLPSAENTTRDALA